MYPDYVLFCVFQIEREMCEKKQTDEDGAVQDSDTESERDAREHSVRVHSPGMTFFLVSLYHRPPRFEHLELASADFCVIHQFLLNHYIHW